MRANLKSSAESCWQNFRRSADYVDGCSYFVVIQKWLAPVLGNLTADTHDAKITRRCAMDISLSHWPRVLTFATVTKSAVDSRAQKSAVAV
jgi:hypothetical protein